MQAFAVRAGTVVVQAPKRGRPLGDVRYKEDEPKGNVGRC